MFTFLDLLVLVSMALIAAGLLSVVLMFLVKNSKVQHVCFYITVALSLYIAYVGLRINWPYFLGQAVLAAALAVVSAGALVLTRIKQDSKMFLYARIIAAAALFLGTVNALLI